MSIYARFSRSGTPGRLYQAHVVEGERANDTHDAVQGRQGWRVFSTPSGHTRLDRRNSRRSSFSPLTCMSSPRISNLPPSSDSPLISSKPCRRAFVDRARVKRHARRLCRASGREGCERILGAGGGDDACERKRRARNRRNLARKPHHVPEACAHVARRGNLSDFNIAHGEESDACGRLSSGTDIGGGLGYQRSPHVRRAGQSRTREMNAMLGRLG